MSGIAQNDAPSNPQYVVTLIHGTWARHAKWIRPDSDFAASLKERLGPETTIVPFQWSGRNSPSARNRAAERLTSELDCKLRKYQDARHYVVCHSHGGNVALEAMKNHELQEKIQGVVCLATPFLVAQKRDLGPNGTTYLVGAMAAAGFLVMLAAIGMLPQDWSELSRRGFAALLMAVVTGVSLPLFVGWEKYSEKLLEKLTPPSLEGANARKLLIVRSAADEASGALVFSQFASQLSVLLFLKGSRLLDKVNALPNWVGKHRWRAFALSASALVLTIAILISVTTNQFSGWGSWWQWLEVFGMITFGSFIIPIYGWWLLRTVLQFAVSAAIWPITLTISLILLIPYGWEIAAANILLNVTSEAAPLGSWPVNLFSAPTSDELSIEASALMHSRVYENPRVIQFVCDWMVGRDAQQGVPGDALQQASLASGHP